nr:DUF1294 domain-containing protein [Pseudoalteromonas sp. MMG010]
MWFMYFYAELLLVVPSYFSVLSVFTFLLYAWDKHQAQQSNYKKVTRTAERTLQFWALLGGWPGALIGQQWLRHKSQKRSFILKLWLMILVNIGVVSLLITSFYRAA